MTEFQVGKPQSVPGSLFARKVRSTRRVVACLAGWMRLATGSVWPPVLLHSAWNAVMQGAFDRATKGADAKLWIKVPGESDGFSVAP